MADKRIPKRNPKNRTKSISLPKKVCDAIQERADKEGRSFSNMVTRILEYQVSDYTPAVAEKDGEYNSKTVPISGPDADQKKESESIEKDCA